MKQLVVLENINFPFMNATISLGEGVGYNPLQLDRNPFNSDNRVANKP